MIDKEKTQEVKELLKDAIEGEHKEYGICSIIDKLDVNINHKLRVKTYFKEAHDNIKYFILGRAEFKECSIKEDFWSGQGGELRRKWCRQVINDIDNGEVGVVDDDCLTLLEGE